MPELQTKDRLISVSEVAAIVGVSVRTTYRMVEAGTIPEPIMLASRLPRWKLSDIESYIESL